MIKILKNFFVLEGLDGSGTTTQLKLLESYFNERNISHFITREPTENPTGLLVRELLSGKTKANQSTIARAFATDRDDHINNSENGILVHLNRKEIVISDRYLFSSVAYQSIGFDAQQVLNLNASFPLPQTIFYLDTPVSTCLSRIDRRGADKEIYEKEDYLKLVCDNYNSCFSYFENLCSLHRTEIIRIIKIDGTLSINEIHSKIIKEIIKN